MNQDNTTARWRRIRTLFQQALAQPVEAQGDFLKQAAAGDVALYDEVVKLLDAAQSTDINLSEVVADAAVDVHQTGYDESIQNYRVIDLLGEGGMGQVYLAERSDDQYQQQVAIKVLGVRRPTDELVQRFRAERQMLATLNHINIAKLLDGGETEDGAPFLVMEYIDGQSIDTYCDAHSLDTRARLRLFMKVCSAVDHAHRNLIIHRDIKPSNIMVDDQGEPRLLDFGIAKLLEEDGDGLQTRSSARLMSPLHASPEQVRGESISVASDVYSLGVLLYQMLTGQHPYSGDVGTPAEIERAICETEPAKPSSRITDASTSANEQRRIASLRGSTSGELVRVLGGDLDNIVLMAMHKEPDRRYASAREFQADIERFLEQRPVVARPSGLTYRAGLFVRRNLLPTAIAAIASVFVVASTAIAVYRITEERDLATAEREKSDAVSDFLMDVFSQANAEVAQGEDTTARELLDIGANTVSQNLASDPGLRAVMLRVLGEAFYSLGNEDRAEALYLEAINTQTAQTSPALDEIATLELLIGAVEQDRSNLDEAEARFERARQLRRQEFGEESFEYAEVLSMQGHLKFFQGDVNEAIALFEEGLAIMRRIGGVNGFSAEFLSKLATAYRELDQLDEAERLLDEALPILASDYGVLHPRYLEAQRYLADVYRGQGRFDQSKRLYLANIESRIEVLGPEHPEVSTTYNELGILLSDMGDIDGAVDALNESLRILEINYDEPTAQLGASYNNIAWMKMEQSDYAGAVSSFEQSIGVQDAIGLADDHIHRSFPIYGRAVARLGAGDFSKAAEEFELVLTMRRVHFEESSEIVSQVKVELGAALIGLGRGAEAEAVLLEALTHLDEHQGDSHRTTVLARQRLDEAQAM